MIKGRSRQYLRETIIDADYADNLMLLVNTPVQAESLLHSLEQAMGSIGFYVNAQSTYILNKTLSSKPLKLVDHVTWW